MERVKSSNEIKQLINILPDWLYDMRIDTAAIDKGVERVSKYFDYQLLNFQKFIIALILGVRDGDGILRFSDMFLEMGRGSGKNAFAAGLAFDFITSDINDYHVDIIANSEEQAKTSFEDVAQAIENNSNLQKAFYKTKVAIQYKKTRSKLKYRTSSSKTADGNRPGAVIFDEVHMYKDYELIKPHISGLGKVNDGRTLYISTNGDIRNGVFDDLEAEALEVLRGNRKYSRMLPIIYRIDDKKEAENPDDWIKAVPLLESWKPIKIEMLKRWEEAQQSPALLSEFMTKRMNIAQESSGAKVAEWEKIAATNRQLPDLSGFHCVGGLDYAEINDFAAVGLLFRDGDQRFYKQHSFLCEKALSLRKYNRDLIREAVNKGVLTIVNTEIVEPEFLANWFLEQSRDHIILRIACDSYRERLIREAFEAARLPIEIVRSGAITHSKIAPVIDAVFAKELIAFGDDPLMRWYTNNVKVIIDGKGNKTYDKIEPKKRKTDGFMSMVHAFVVEDILLEYGNKSKPRAFKAFSI